MNALHSTTRAGSLVAGALAIALFLPGCASPSEAPSQSVSDSEVSAESPGNSVTAAYDFTPDLINIPAGLSDQEYGARLLDVFTQWSMAGATDETYAAWIESGLSDSTQSDVAARNLRTVQGSHLFSDTGLANETIQVAMQNFALANEGNVQAWLATYDPPGAKPTPGQEEAFNHTLTLDSVEVISTAEGRRELIISGTEHNNSAKNTYSTHENLVRLNGMPFQFRVVTTVIDGFEQIDLFLAS